MKVGTFGGQIEALRREVRNIEKEERQRGNRRAFLGALGGLATGAVAGFGLQGGAKPASATEKKAESKQGKAQPAPEHRLAPFATGPTKDLIGVRWQLVTAIRAEPDHPTLKIGLARLLHVAIDGTAKESEALGRMFLAIDPKELADEFAPVLETLRAVRANKKK